MNLSPSLSYEEIFNQLRLAEGDCMANVVLAGQQKLETGMRDSAASCLLSPPLLIVNVVTSCCCCHRLRRAQTETDRERLVVSYLSSRESGRYRQPQSSGEAQMRLVIVFSYVYI